MAEGRSSSEATFDLLDSVERPHPRAVNWQARPVAVLQVAKIGSSKLSIKGRTGRPISQVFTRRSWRHSPHHDKLNTVSIQEKP